MEGLQSFLMELGNIQYFASQKLTGSGQVDAFSYTLVDGMARVSVHVMGLGHCVGSPAEVLDYFVRRSAEMDLAG